MKKITLILTSVMLALVIAAITPVHAFASSTAGTAGKYISEVRVGYAKNSDDAKAALDGYTILKDKNGKDVDLNANAGGGTGSKGDRCVYLGYKTTDDPDEGITDLAVMNMKGGYSVKDYESLMDTQMKSQIIPFVDNFKTAIDEYRVNYSSDNEENKARAQYVHDCLNRLLDDDTGKKLGDLLLSQTKYEMGDDAYNDLSDSEKKEHADILTIIAQANGQATIMMENLITRGADTSDDTWLDRLKDITYDDLVDETGLAPSKARQSLDKTYYDTALKIAPQWEDFRDVLLDYDNQSATVAGFDADAYTKACDDLENADDSISEEEHAALLNAYMEAENKRVAYETALQYTAIHDYLKETEYDGGTMLDLFTTDSSDLSVIYPFIASLSDGQKAGFEFVSIREFFAIAMTDKKGYSEISLEGLEETSLYDGVDREIYEPGGVALTSDAIRNDVASVQEEENNKRLSPLTITMLVITGVTFAAFAGAASTAVYYRVRYAIAQRAIAKDWTLQILPDNWQFVNSYRQYAAKSSFCAKLSAGLGVAMILIAGFTTYLTWRDLTDRYKVDFSPIPKFIVDEKDIVAMNSKGEKEVIKNQSAYYKVVPTNRNKGDDWYDVLGDSSDLGGGVGKQWVALYSVKNDSEAPILASSLLAVVNDSNLPAGYETGIHMFGTEAAFNTNNALYVWNEDAPQTYVYFQRDENAKADAEGSIFSGGLYAIIGAGGIMLGVLGTVLATKLKKKKESTVES